MTLDYDIYDIVGSVGVLLIVGAYFMLMIRRIASTDLGYSALNAIGAALIIFSLSHDFNFAAFLMELFLADYQYCRDGNGDPLQAPDHRPTDVDYPAVPCRNDRCVAQRGT